MCVCVFPVNGDQGMLVELGEQIAVRSFHRRGSDVTGGESSIHSGCEHRLQSQIESGSDSGTVTY